ncbi:MAG: DNA translocase FtsK 4TM domain-containing protein, partial [Paludibacteraceae bacterium]|nr:DNA translocase FtsK 4TM domain-containing protein [Paludibacteraceae bacterium]
MAKKTNTKQPSKIDWTKVKAFFQNEKTRIITGLLLLVLSFYVFLSLLSFVLSGEIDYNMLHHTLSDIQAQGGEYANAGSSIGAKIAHLFINQWFGISTLLWPIFLGAISIKLLHPTLQYSLSKGCISTLFFTIWFSVFMSLVLPVTSVAPYLQLGGNHGNQMVLLGKQTIGTLGISLILFTSLLIYCVIGFVQFYHKIEKAVIRLFKRKEKPVVEETEPAMQDTTVNNMVDDNEADDVDIPLVDIEEPLAPQAIDEIDSANEVEVDVPSPAPVAEEKKGNDDIPFEVTNASEQEADANNEISFEVIKGEDLGSELVDQYGVYDPTLDLPQYKYPTFDLLKKFDTTAKIDAEEQQANKERIIRTLQNYGVGIKEIKATIGPTITLYEIVPADGIRISRIRNLGDDIALSLSAIGIRIIAPIPGKGTIGIEVPNKHAQIVPMQSLLASKKFQETTYDLPIAIGKTITDEVFMVDLAKLPHLLVAGATGQGKSVGLNAIITSLLYKKHPSQLKLILVDPKKVEFSIYSDLEKHFLAKLPENDDAIITDVNKVVQTLNSVCKEMDDRNDLFKKAHVRNIKEYNEKFVNRKLNPEKGHRFLPYIVVIIDEFADLIMTAGKEVEMPIARIAQLARAAGIHAIIATQRPAANIITGNIKANFPGRMAFRVASQIDSRTILDASGANQLIGRGDLLFLQGSDLVRVQCAFIDTPEVEAICRHIGEQQGYPQPFALPEVEISDGDTNLSGVDMSKRDPMFDEVARMVVLSQSGSTSMIQRKFSIGYNRAGRIMDQLEAAGIVGAADGSKSRAVLVQDEMQLDRLLETL